MDVGTDHQLRANGNIENEKKKIENEVARKENLKK